MKTFKQYVESCWKGYEAIGVKKKNGKTVPNCVPVKEDGAAAGCGCSAGPTNTVGGVAGTGDSRLAPDQREPGVSKKKNSPVMMGFRRKPPKI